MKTIPLSEVLKLATPGPLEVRMGLADHACLYIQGTHYIVALGLRPKDAALLAHRWNTHDDLIEALEIALGWVEPESGDHARLLAVHARATTVEMP
jgi:hypothetical protein